MPGASASATRGRSLAVVLARAAAGRGSINAVNALRRQGTRPTSSARSTRRATTRLVRSRGCGGKRSPASVGHDDRSKHARTCSRWGRASTSTPSRTLRCFRYQVPASRQIGTTLEARHHIGRPPSATPPTAEGDRTAVMIVPTDVQVPQSLAKRSPRRRFLAAERSRCGLRPAAPGRRSSNSPPKRAGWASMPRMARQLRHVRHAGRQHPRPGISTRLSVVIAHAAQRGEARARAGRRAHGSRKGD